MRVSLWWVLLVLIPLGMAQFQPVSEPDFSGYEVREDLATAGDTAQADRILRFVQVSDAHILDDDAPYPMRQEVLDMFGDPFTSAQRAQEEYTDEVLDSIVRAINGINAQDGLDFVINTGDNIDNELENELMRFLDNWEGTTTTLSPVSGLECVPDGQSESIDDDTHDSADVCTSLPEALAANNTPLTPGLPWFSAFGNHDGLIQGNVPNEPRFDDIAAENGRNFLNQDEYVGMHFAAGSQCAGGAPAGTAEDDNGHGYGYAGDRLCDDDPDNDGYYAFSMRGVRLIVLDTVNDDFVASNPNLMGAFNPQATLGNDVIGGYAEGSVDGAQFDWMMQEIEDHPDELVVIFSHHTINSMFTEMAEGYCAEGVGCLHDLLTEAGYKTGTEIQAALTQYPNVVAWIGGHTHQHRVQPKSDAGAPSPGFWNVETSSLIDWPQEARVIELWATPDGKAFLKLQPFGHDFQLSKDLVSQDDQQKADAAGTAEDQAVLLWLDVPEGVALTPQPELPRGLRLEITAPIDLSGLAGGDLSLVVTAFDTLTDLAVPGLDVIASVTGPDGTAIAAAVNETAPGQYTVSFRTATGGDHTVAMAVHDMSGTYPDATSDFTVGVLSPPGADEGKKSPGPTGFVALALVVCLALAARLQRQNR